MKPEQGHDLEMTPKKSHWVNIAILMALVAIGGIGVTKVFGTKVSSKFTSANDAVESHVTFDGGGSYSSSNSYRNSGSAPRTVVQKQVAREVVSSPRGASNTKLAAAQSAARRAQAELKRREQLVTKPLEDAVRGDASELDNSVVKSKHHGVNPMTRTSEDPFSTFAIDVDTASYTMARNRLNSHAKPSPSAVRVEEFVNYFDYDYPNPTEGAFGVNLEAAPSPFSAEKDRYLVRVGVQGKRILDKHRKPSHLTFLVDVSGSMRAHDKLPMAREALKTLVENLGPKDTVSIVTYAGRTGVVLEPTSANNKDVINQAFATLQSGGGTNMGSGMTLAYEQAVKAHKPGHNSRVVVISDGDANIGNTSHHEILKTIEGYIADGITMTTLGFGSGGYNDHLMEQLANKGNGNYYFVDSQAEANKLFTEDLTGALEVIAKDVKIQVQFNPEAISEYRLIGYENRDIADEDFRNDAVDAGEIGAGHAVTALYEIVLTDPSIDHLAKVRVRHKKPVTEEVTEYNYPLTRDQVKSSLSNASRSFKFAAAVAAFAELLRGSPYAKNVSYELVKEIAENSAGKHQERQEFVGLVEKAIRIHQDRSSF